MDLICQTKLNHIYKYIDYIIINYPHKCFTVNLRPNTLESDLPLPSWRRLIPPFIIIIYLLVFSGYLIVIIEVTFTLIIFWKLLVITNLAQWDFHDYCTFETEFVFVMCYSFNIGHSVLKFGVNDNSGLWAFQMQLESGENGTEMSWFLKGQGILYFNTLE